VNVNGKKELRIGEKHLRIDDCGLLIDDCGKREAFTDSGLVRSIADC